jgi:hypothetical protein
VVLLFCLGELPRRFGRGPTSLCLSQMIIVLLVDNPRLARSLCADNRNVIGDGCSGSSACYFRRVQRGRGQEGFSHLVLVRDNRRRGSLLRIRPPRTADGCLVVFPFDAVGTCFVGGGMRGWKDLLEVTRPQHGTLMYPGLGRAVRMRHNAGINDKGSCKTTSQ